MPRRTPLGRTPNPCIECNRHLKFRRFLDRAVGSALTPWRPATTPASRDNGHGVPRLLRGRDLAKDQSYVLSMLTVRELARVLLPVGELTKREVRARAAGPAAAHGHQARQPGGVLCRGRPGPGPPRSASWLSGSSCTRAASSTARPAPSSVRCLPSSS